MILCYKITNSNILQQEEEPVYRQEQLPATEEPIYKQKILPTNYRPKNVQQNNYQQNGKTNYQKPNENYQQQNYNENYQQQNHNENDQQQNHNENDQQQNHNENYQQKNDPEQNNYQQKNNVNYQQNYRPKEQMAHQQFEMNYNYEKAKGIQSIRDSTDEGLPYYAPEPEPENFGTTQSSYYKAEGPVYDIQYDNTKNRYNQREINYQVSYDDTDYGNYKVEQNYKPSETKSKTYFDDDYVKNDEYKKALLQQFVKQLEIVKMAALKELYKDELKPKAARRYEQVIPTDDQIAYDDYHRHMISDLKSKYLTAF